MRFHASSPLQEIRLKLIMRRKTHVNYNLKIYQKSLDPLKGKNNLHLMIYEMTFYIIMQEFVFTTKLSMKLYDNIFSTLCQFYLFIFTNHI